MTGSVEVIDDDEIIVRIGSEGETLRFDSFNDLAHWAENERAIWAQMSGSQQELRGAGPRIVQPQSQYFEQLATLAAHAVNHSDEGRRQSFRDQAASHLGLVAVGDVPVSTTASGQRILQVFEQDPVLGIAHLAWAPRKDIDVQTGNNPNLLQFTRAMIDARLDQRLGKEDVKAQQQSLQKLRRRWDGRFSAIEKKQKAICETFESDLGTVRSLAAQAIRKFNRVRRGFEESLSNTQQAYTTHMQMMASELYWADRKKESNDRARNFLIAFIACVCIGAAALIWAFEIVLKAIPILSQQAFGTLHFFAYGVPTLFVIWILRLLYGQYRASKDVAADADERIAMIKTFKALEYEGKASDAERAIILQALFRPYKESIDEGVPHPVWESILKNVGGSKP